MHLGNGAITPECGILALGIAATAAGAAWVSARRHQPAAVSAATAGALGAAVFAAQMFNVPVGPFSSAHLIGGVLLAWALGPAFGLLTMSLVLTLQACLLADGGLLTLGANIINMAVVPAAVVAAIGRWGNRGGAGRQALVFGAAAGLSTIAAAALIVLEVAVGRSGAQLDGLAAFASSMLSAHLAVAMFEALVTAALLSLLARPTAVVGRLQLSPWRAAAVAGMSLVVALASLPAYGLTSQVPDAYESALLALARAGYSLGLIDTASSLNGWNATAQAWQDALVGSIPGPSALLVVLFTLAAGSAAWATAKLSSPGVGQRIANQ